MSSIDGVTLAELVSEELSKLDIDNLLGIAKEIRHSLSFCLSRMLLCAELVDLLCGLVKSLSQVRLSKAISGAVPEGAGEDSFVDLGFLRGITRALYTYYLILLFGLADHELRIPVKFEEDVILGERKYRAFSSRLVSLLDAVALTLMGVKVRMLIPSNLVKHFNELT